MNCRLCSAETRKTYRLTGHRRNDYIQVYYCSDCSAYYTDPPQFDYNNPDPGIIEYYTKLSDYINWRHNRIFDFVEKFCTGTRRRFLDIGAGAGFSLKVAELRGWEPNGIEPCQELVEFARNKLHVNVIQGFFDATMLLEGTTDEVFFEPFDYILIDNVLEHVRDPVSFLDSSLALLKSGGLLLVAIPPIDWFRQVLATFSFVRNYCNSPILNQFHDPEQHINYFSRKSMHILVERFTAYRLLNECFHHHKSLNNWIVKLLGFESGYYFITKES